MKVERTGPAAFTAEFETEEELLLFADLPGGKPEDLDVRFENGELTVHGKCPARRQGEPLWRQSRGRRGSRSPGSGPTGCHRPNGPCWLEC